MLQVYFAATHSGRQRPLIDRDLDVSDSFVLHLQQTPNERANVNLLGHVTNDGHVGHFRSGDGPTDGVERKNRADEVAEPTGWPGRANTHATGTPATRVAQSTCCI